MVTPATGGLAVTMDVHGHLLAPAKMRAAEAMSRALWLEDLPGFDPSAASLAAVDAADASHNVLTSDEWAARVSIPAPWD